MKLGPLDDIIKSLSYALHNEAGTRVGLFFQFYAFLWIVISSFFVVTRILSIDERPDPIYVASAPFCMVFLYIPLYAFWIYEKKIGIEKRRVREMQLVSSVNIEYRFSEPVDIGIAAMLYFRINNPTDKPIENIWIRGVFPATVRCDRPVLSLGSLEPISSLSSSFAFVPLTSGNLSMGYCDLYFEINGHKNQRPPLFFGNIDIVHSYLGLDVQMPKTLRFGHSSVISIRIWNRSNPNLEKLHTKCNFQKGIQYDTAFSDTRTVPQGALFEVTHQITPTAAGTIDLGYFEIIFDIEDNKCKIGPVNFGEYMIHVPEIDFKINIPETLYSTVGNTIGIYVENKSEEVIHNICFNSCFSSFIECHRPNVCITDILPYSSGYTSLSIKPVNAGQIDLGNLNISFEVNDVTLQKEPIDMGTHGVV
ncbi:MAG: hypothetical protein QCH31_04800 [Methanolobus sp.]|nr:hypothetical protein [Methanolobus sp.]